MKFPLHKGHGFDMIKLVLFGPNCYVRKANANGAHIRGNLHQTSNFHEGAQGAEKESHQILMAPVDQGVAIKKTSHRSCMRKVVVHSPKAALKAFELGVHGNPRAVDLMVHLCQMLLEGRDGFINFLVPLSKHFAGLEGRRYETSHMTQDFAMLGQVQREAQVGIPKDRRIGDGIDQLQAVEAAHGDHTIGIWHATFCTSSQGQTLLRLINELLQLLAAIIMLHHIAQIFVAKLTEHTVKEAAQIPSLLESQEHIDGAAPKALPFMPERHMG
mmetsp:Transcript_27572/g.60026  ORF Transcript_27572/g.60026 Transcript_27572/m.60026 type:complete len:272 (+) Transcript_27572:395-1210(+)